MHTAASTRILGLVPGLPESALLLPWRQAKSGSTRSACRSRLHSGCRSRGRISIDGAPPSRFNWRTVSMFSSMIVG